MLRILQQIITALRMRYKLSDGLCMPIWPDPCLLVDLISNNSLLSTVGHTSQFISSDKSIMHPKLVPPHLSPSLSFKFKIKHHLLKRTRQRPQLHRATLPLLHDHIPMLFNVLITLKYCTHLLITCLSLLKCQFQPSGELNCCVYCWISRAKYKFIVTAQ